MLSSETLCNRSSMHDYIKFSKFTSKPHLCEMLTLQSSLASMLFSFGCTFHLCWFGNLFMIKFTIWIFLTAEAWWWYAIMHKQGYLWILGILNLIDEMPPSGNDFPLLGLICYVTIPIFLLLVVVVINEFFDFCLIYSWLGFSS